ncbi:MAG: hypothetical protein ACI3W5_03040, partial [Faecousia sp.]
MKKVLSVLLALAMVIGMVPAVFADESTKTMTLAEGSGCSVAANADNGIAITFTPEYDGTVTFTISGNPGWDLWNYTGGVSESVCKTAGSGTYQVDVTANTEYKYEIWGYAYEEDTTDISYSVVLSYTEGTGGAGTNTDPITLEAGVQKEITIPVGESVEVVVDATQSDMELTVVPNRTYMDWKIQLGEDAYTPYPSGAQLIELAAGQKYTLTITNTSEDVDQVVTVVASKPAVGTMDRPDSLILGTNSAELEANQEYYYSWTAPSNGTLTVTIADTCDDWYYSLTIGYSSEMHGTGDDKTQTYAVTEGDELSLAVATYSYAAGTVTFTVSFAAESGGTSDPDEPSNETGSITVTKGTKEEIAWTAPADGVLTVTAASTGTGTFWYKGIDETYYDFANLTSVEKSYAVTAGTEYTVGFWAIGGDIAIEYTLSFVEGGTLKEQYIISDYIIGLDGASSDGETAGEYHVTNPTVGTHTITMEENAEMTLVEMAPEETGTYKITVSGSAVIGNCNIPTYIIIPSSGDMGTEMEYTCTQTGYYYDVTFDDGSTEQRWANGQSVMLGIISEDPTVTLTIVKTSEYENEEIPTVTYENKATLSQFAVSGCMTLGDYVDVYGEDHTAVYSDADGYYHLDSVDGPVLLVDMDYNGIVLTDALNQGRGTMYVTVTDAEGNKVRYDIGAAASAYTAVTDSDGYYPLTEDLILFYKDYAIASGTYLFYLTDQSYNEQCVWMYCMRTVTIAHTWEETGRTDATCTVDGKIEYTCSGCGETKEEAITAPGHTPEEYPCYDYPYEDFYSYDLVYHCTVCGEEVSREKYPVGCQGNPYTITDENSDTTAVIEYSASIPAGETYYYSGRVGLTTLTLDAEGISVTVDGVELTPVDGVFTYVFPKTDWSMSNPVIGITNNGEDLASLSLNFTYPVGHEKNRDYLQLGSTTVTLAEDNDGYYFTWVAECNGTLTIGISGDGWEFSVDDIGDPDDWSDDFYGNLHYSDDNPVVNEVQVEVDQGDVVHVYVVTFDPNDWWTIPAGTVTVNASFTHKNIEHVDALQPACHSNGNIEYWYCPDCGTFFQNEACTEVTNAKRVILPATGSENLEHHEAVAATCEENGNIEYWYCPDCDTYFQDEACTQVTNAKNVIIGALNHCNLRRVEALEPTCHDNGNIEYWYCPDCDTYFQDETCTEVTNAKRVILPATGSE